MGYNATFLGSEQVIGVPQLDELLRGDLVLVEGSPVIDYTHFSLAMSSTRRLARWVAWNIDGSRFDFASSISRDDADFRPDPRVDLDAQTLDDLYASNSLDRGHLARRSDLLWGPLAEARKANEDSFYFTNISPQRASFNQSGASGVWGELEDALLASAKADEQRVSVFAGPVLDPDDLPYRGTRIPASYWKVVAYSSADLIRTHAFVLTQNLDELEQIALEEFAVYEVPISDLEQRTRLTFDASLYGEPLASALPQRISSARDLSW